MENIDRSRKLASIQKVVDIQPIPGADAIECLTILGWHIVGKKDEFQVGDPCVYVEIDSVLPERPEFEFLRPRGFRIRTVRLRGQISQGIAFPVEILDAVSGQFQVTIEEGADVTEMLGVIKYERPIDVSIGGEVAGPMPGFLLKTDEPRIQSNPGVLARHTGRIGYASEKLDGCSGTFFLKDGDFRVCCRNLELRETEGNVFWKVAKEYGIEERLRVLGGEFALQGEVLGPKIQGNRYKLKKHEVRFFNLFDIRKSEYLPFPLFMDTVQVMMGLQTVPILDEQFPLPENVDEMLRFAEGKSMFPGAEDVEREGIVWRPLEEIHDPDIGRLSVKAISNRFLLKGGE